MPRPPDSQIKCLINQLIDFIDIIASIIFCAENFIDPYFDDKAKITDSPIGFLTQSESTYDFDLLPLVLQKGKIV
jgi:hypothetical protein